MARPTSWTRFSRTRRRQSCFSCCEIRPALPRPILPAGFCIRDSRTRGSTNRANWYSISTAWKIPPARCRRNKTGCRFRSRWESSATMTRAGIVYALEIGGIVSDNKLGARSGAPSMSAPDLYSADNGGPQNPAREKMVALRVTLLRLHKTLLDMERREYERANGHVTTGELFRLVIDHQQFAWLHNLSEFVVRLDETLSAEEAVTQNETHSAIMLARKMFAPSESGDAFQKRYFDAIQRDPAVVMEHAELARLFANEPSDASPT